MVLMNRVGVFYLSYGYANLQLLLGKCHVFKWYLSLIIIILLSACSDDNKISQVNIDRTNIDLAYQAPARVQSSSITDATSEPIKNQLSAQSINHGNIAQTQLLNSLDQSSADSNQEKSHNNQWLSAQKLPQSSPSEADNSPKALFSQQKQQVIRGLIANHHYKRPEVKNIQLTFLANESTLSHYLKSLDAYSRYFSKAQFEFIKYRQRKVRKGIGVSLLIDNNKILAVPISGGALHKAGLREPRYLQTLNNRVVDYNEFSSYRALVNTALGRAIHLTIVPYSKSEKKQYRAVMQKIRRKPIVYQEIADAAVIRIDEFSDDVANKMQRLLKKARHKRYLVIDLRYSPGGDLYATVDMSSFFIKSGVLVTQLKQRGQYAPIELNALNTFKDRHKKVYLLTSRFTASAAEIFIHALKHYHNNVMVLGEKTVGKCLAQSIHELPDRSALLLSSYELTLPTKKVCQGRVIQPNKIIKNIELLSVKDVLLHIK